MSHPGYGAIFKRMYVDTIKRKRLADVALSDSHQYDTDVKDLAEE